MTEQDEILIVDDDPLAVRLLTNILSTGGFQVRLAGSGELALRSVASEPPGLIFLDIGLPGIDGFEVCRRLKAQEDSRDIPVMIISGLTDLDVNVKGFGLGAVDFISKPYQREELLARVRTHLELSRLRTKLEIQVAERTAQLRKSAEEIEDLYNNAPCGYHSLDENGIFQRINHTELRWLGYTRNELIGEKKFSDLIASENLPTFRENFSRLKTEGFVGELELEIIRKDGTTFPVLLNASVIYDSPGHYLMIRSTMFDITERKRAEEALRKSEERYRNIVEQSIMGIGISKGNQVLFANNALLGLFNYDDLEEFKKIPLLDHVAPSSKALITGRIKMITEGKTPPPEFEYDIISKGGLIRTLHASNAHLSLGGEGFNQTTFMDITERKRLEEIVRQSEERYRTIIETIEDGYYEVDLPGNLTYFNDAMSRINGYSRVEMQGMNSRQYTDAQNARIIYQAFNQVYRTGESSKGIYYEIITKNGERKNLETSVSLIRDPSGDPIGFRGIARDVTELRQTQKALQTSEERFRVAAESSNDFIYEWNLESGQVDWFGKAVERLNDMLGDLPNTSVAFVKKIHPEDLERITQAVRRHLKQGDPHLEEYRLVGKDGDLIHIISAGMCLRNEDGRAFKWIGALSDITERKRAEEELKNSLDKLHKAMGGIIQAMALTVESKDPYTAGHQQRVSSLARTIAQEMGLSKDQIEAIRMAGVVHDLGKISLPAEILSKPTKLSDVEFSLIKGHSQTSYDILKDIEFPWPIAEIALQHHERMDGSGYPSGLKGDQILIEAQILMVADVVEAIASHRPYRPAQGIEVALDEISKNKGKLYNPAAVDACLRLFREKGYKFK